MDAERWRTVERVFHEASNLPEAGRADYVARACAGDAELQGEIETLLRENLLAPLKVRRAVQEEARELFASLAPGAARKPRER